jgi:parvulin-like peptidyl-prolyl isomerase
VSRNTLSDPLGKVVALILLSLLGVLAGRPAVAAPGDASPDAYFGPTPQPSGNGMPASFNPGPPTAPIQTIRPSGWPGATPADATNAPGTVMPPAGYPGPNGSLPGVSIAPYQQPQPGEARLDGIAPIGNPSAGMGQNGPMAGGCPQGPSAVAPYCNAAPQTQFTPYCNNVPPTQTQYAPYSPAYGQGPPAGQPSPPAYNSNSSPPPGGQNGIGPARPDGAPAAAAKEVANVSRMEPCTSTQIFARVGSDVILAADVMPRINELLAARLKDVPREQIKQMPPQQLDAVRVAWAKQMLEEFVKVKLVYLDAKQEIPKEHFPDVEKKIEEVFDKDEVPRIMARLKVNSRPEMENKLRANGTTLERERQAHLERFLAEQWKLEKVKISKEISEEETIRYYREHVKEFEHPAQARWEELMTRIASYPTRAAALDALAQMGNAVIHGASLAEIAKARSDGPTASKGGTHAWTNRGSLVSEEMDQALFGLRIGAMSQIIEDKVGFHIIRVIERKDVYRTPFLEAQVMIRIKIKEERTKKETLAYIEKLREQTPVWIASDLSGGLIPLALDSLGSQTVKEAARPADNERQR